MYNTIERYAHRYSRNLADHWRGVTQIDTKSLATIAQEAKIGYSLTELYPQMDPLVRVLQFIGMPTREYYVAIRIVRLVNSFRIKVPPTIAY